MVVGEEETDPVVMVFRFINTFSSRTTTKSCRVIAGEDLNILVGSMPLEGEEKKLLRQIY